MYWPAGMIEALSDRAYRSIDDDPEVLFDAPRSYRLDADLFRARLIGLDEQVEDEFWMPEMRDVWLCPIPERLTAAAPTTPVAFSPRVATYDLLGGHSVINFAAFYHDVRGVPQRADGNTVIAFLRYRRRI